MTEDSNSQLRNASASATAHAGLKYKFPKGFRKELVLYNLNRAKEDQKESGLILVEGFFSVLKLYEAGLPNVVASMGCELSDEQARLCAEAKEVIILYDGNDAGYIGAAKAKAKLAPLVPVRIVKLDRQKCRPSWFPRNQRNHPCRRNGASHRADSRRNTTPARRGCLQCRWIFSRRPQRAESRNAATGTSDCQSR